MMPAGESVGPPAARPARVLVTGSAGFIGRHLAAALVEAGYQVTGLDLRLSGFTHPRFREVVCDLRDAAATRAAVQADTPTWVAHLAARTDLDEHASLADYAANTDGVRNLLAAIHVTPSVHRLVCTSSQLVCRVGYRPANDDDYCPSTVYGESKVETERIVKQADGAGVVWCLVRPTTIWGPGMNPHYLTFFRMIRDGRYFHVGSGPTPKSYGYVGNTVYQYRRLLEAPASALHRRVFYLADYEPLVLETWAEAFQRALHAPPIRTLPLPVAIAAAKVGDVVNRLGVRRFPFNSFRLGNVRTAYQVDLSATAAVCGPLPYDVAEGVTRTVAWLRDCWGMSTAA
jgi:nucleoside-diphosphate-sugar epimerase